MQQTKYLLCALLLTFAPQQVLACDACGCSATGNGVGLYDGKAWYANAGLQ